MPHEIAIQIQSEIKKYTDTILDMNPEFVSTQGSVLDLINLYWVSKFKDGSKESGGYRQTFYNIIENPTLVSSKQIDLDTKDIRIIAEDSASYWPAWLFQKELKLWMKEQKIGKLLNEIISVWPKYGHLVLKKIEDTLFVTDISNVIVDPANEETPYLIEGHDMLEEELLNMKTKGWDADVIDEILEKKDEGQTKFRVYERYGFVSGNKNNYFIVVLEGKGKYELLFQGKMKSPYRELRWEKIPGRWLGRGIVEKLLEAQIAKNEVENMFRKGLQWSSKKVFQSRDETIARNLLTEVDNGELLRVQSEITQVPMDERNLSAYSYADQKWDVNIQKRTFATDIIRGERSPAGTPLGSDILRTQQAGTFFDLKKENLGLFLKDIILNDIIPSFKKNRKKAHKFVLYGDETELMKFEQAVVTSRTNKAKMRQLAKKGRLTMEDAEILKVIETERLKKPGTMEMEIPESFYDDIKYKVDVVITSEQVDTAARIATLQTLFQIVASNPAVMRDKQTKRILFKALDLAGINPEEFDFPEEIGVEELAQRGGSISPVPAIAPSPATATIPRTL